MVIVKKLEEDFFTGPNKEALKSDD